MQIAWWRFYSKASHGLWRYCTVPPTSLKKMRVQVKPFFWSFKMENHELEYFKHIADSEMLGYELIELVVTLYEASRDTLTERQKDIVQELDLLLTHIYIRDRLEEAEKEREELFKKTDGE